MSRYTPSTARGPVEVQEHESGFPAVTVDCEDIHILTDIISLEKWWSKKKEEERS